MVYRVSSRTAWTTQRDPPSEKKSGWGNDLGSYEVYFTQGRECQQETEGEENKSRGVLWETLSLLYSAGRQNHHRTVFLSLNIIRQWISIYSWSNDIDLTFKWLEKLKEDANKRV